MKRLLRSSASQTSHAMQQHSHLHHPAYTTRCGPHHNRTPTCAAHHFVPHLHAAHSFAPLFVCRIWPPANTLLCLQAWGDNVAPDTLSLEDLLGVVNLSIFLQADTDPWAAEFCKALVRGHTLLPAAWRLLQAESDHTVAAILRAHPIVHAAQPLATKLQELPPFLHEAAFRADYAAKHPGPPLESAASLVARHVDTLSGAASSMVARMSAALASATGPAADRLRAP